MPAKPKHGHDELRNAALALLTKICDMTTEEFAHGKDRNERVRLAMALGLDPREYSL